jgi:hypothetical protein
MAKAMHGNILKAMKIIVYEFEFISISCDEMTSVVN